ncbi:MAG: hypothetical protein ACOC9W_00825 [Persicimonas sp.]
MLIGFNNDVEYRDMTFHIQTEDHGEGDPRIETQLFHSGAILDTVITSYEETIEGYEGQEAEERIRAQMKASHRSLFKKLMAGEYDEMVGLEPLEEVEEEIAAPDPDEFTPSQERVPAAAAKVEEEGEDAIMKFQKKKAKDHVSLDKLKSQLSKLDAKEEASAQKEHDEVDEADEEDEDDVLPTQVIDTSQKGFQISSAAEDDAQQPEKPAQTTVAAAAGQPALVEYEATGAQAWEGCDKPIYPLSLTDLVEDFLGL